MVPLVFGFFKLSSPCVVGWPERGFTGGVMGDGRVGRIEVVPLRAGPLTGGVRLGLGPMFLGFVGQEGAGFGNLKNLSMSQAI